MLLLSLGTSRGLALPFVVLAHQSSYPVQVSFLSLGLHEVESSHRLPTTNAPSSFYRPAQSHQKGDCSHHSSGYQPATVDVPEATVQPSCFCSYRASRVRHDRNVDRPHRAADQAQNTDTRQATRRAARPEP